MITEDARQAGSRPPGRWPGTVFACESCAGPLARVPDLVDQLGCTDPMCSSAGMTVAVWRAQRHRVRRGQDVAAPGPGWPRPVLAGGLPHPWITPVSDGQPWWTLVDGVRQALAQRAGRCQTCGTGLDDRFLVVHHKGRVVSDSGLHHRCLRVALTVCPYLSRPGTGMTAATVTRTDLLGDGRPLAPPRPDAVEHEDVLWTPAWTLRDQTDPGISIGEYLAAPG